MRGNSLKNSMGCEQVPGALEQDVRGSEKG